MILCLDVGNTQIYGGVFEDNKLLFRFRKQSSPYDSSDEYGLFLRAVLRENNIEHGSIKQVAICTVVPDILHSLKNACRKYFSLTPFVLQAGVKTGLQIKYRNPLEVGSDRIANAIAVTKMYPEQNAIIVDFGTAITLCAVTNRSEYLGGVILPGLRLSMRSLENNTAKLPSVEIIKPPSCLGRSTVESIQSGLYFGAYGAIKECIQQIKQECFKEELPLVIGTGGFASLFANSDLFDEEIDDLVLMGLSKAIQMNL
ncbi:MAG: type III pantothenate kinase [Bdellovibrionales bacterium]|nr:type III pantothenate kinase [Bdellovibrionales bacterium]